MSRYYQTYIKLHFTTCQLRKLHIAHKLYITCKLHIAHKFDIASKLHIASKLDIAGKLYIACKLYIARQLYIAQVSNYTCTTAFRAISSCFSSRTSSMFK